MSFGQSTYPDYATKFKYDHHSPSGIRSPFVKQLIRKMYPDIRDNGPVRMTAGKAAEICATNVVAKGLPFDQAFRDALSVLDTHKISEHIPHDQQNFDLIRDHAPDALPPKTKTSKKVVDQRSIFERACANLCIAATESVRGANQIEISQRVNVELPRCDLWFEGEIDVLTNDIVEIKTSWPSYSETTKQGFRKMKAFNDTPNPWWVRQVAIYWAYMRQQRENVSVKIVCANYEQSKIFTSENCKDLSESNLNEALNFLAAEARTRERILNAAEDEKSLFGMIPADADHWMWHDSSPQLKQKRDELCRR